MVVVRSRRQDEIRFPQPDLSNDFFAWLEGRQQLAVVVVEPDVIDEFAVLLPVLRHATGGESTAPLGLMPGVAVGDRYEPYGYARVPPASLPCRQLSDRNHPGAPRTR